MMYGENLLSRGITFFPPIFELPIMFCSQDPDQKMLILLLWRGLHLPLGPEKNWRVCGCVLLEGPLLTFLTDTETRGGGLYSAD